MHAWKQNLRLRSGRIALFGVVSLAALHPAAARVVRIVIEHKESPAYQGQSFGKAGKYEILTGHAFGELDPQDPSNTIITDIQFAPRNQRGIVEYAATFTLIKPVDTSKASGVLLYEVPNRGNSPVLWPNFRIEDDASQGHVLLVSGWQGELAPRAGLETIAVPVAKNPDGSSITGPVLARLFNLPASSNTASLTSGFSGLLYQRPSTLDTSQATLVEFASDDGQPVTIPSSDWAFADCSKTPFPGSPDSTKICVKEKFDSTLLYQVVFTAKDPLILGIGLAATRDIVSFFAMRSTMMIGTPTRLAARSNTPSPLALRNLGTSSRRSSILASIKTRPTESFGTE